MNAVVLDANILIRSVLGRRVRALLVKYGDLARFFAPDSAYAEARRHLPLILARRGIQPNEALALVNQLEEIVKPVEIEVYAPFERVAKRLIAQRDLDDWPVLALALTLRCPIWTEDRDFFGTGVATWTTDRIEFLLEAESTD